MSELSELETLAETLSGQKRDIVNVTAPIGVRGRHPSVTSTNPPVLWYDTPDGVMVVILGVDEDDRPMIAVNSFTLDGERTTPNILTVEPA